MPRLQEWAATQPDKIAVRMAKGPGLTYRALDERADRAARWLLSLGLQEGDAVALLLENRIETFELWWGARRAGLYYVPVSTQLTAGEVAYLLRDSGARAFVASAALGDLARGVLAQPDLQDVRHRFAIGGAVAGFLGYDDALAGTAGDAPLPRRALGREFMYSSGTTGFPKGIRRPMVPHERRSDLPELERQLRRMFRFDKTAVFLSPSPLYHATGRFVIRAIECGGTAVILRKFDAASALEAIEAHGITHAQWVPTMFVRMLALPPELRARHDLSTLRFAIHAAAPCPPHIKRAMIDWWGPIVHEYYGGSENAGITCIDAHAWLDRPGSVGRPIAGKVHVVAEDDPNRELPVGEVGLVYFSGGVEFAYHGDAEKTRGAFNDRGWATYGDLGHLDAEGFLFISDRRTDLVISGGVNVYPQEVENLLLQHEAVEDVAVVGVPHEELGQQVTAVVQARHAA
ncbi:AMP-binding protein, partial [Ramlibacter sp.]|uniref:AMP-binding protein n=1 Tax=Ramlibacter sp. TaxID=1917967 RepID=UPI003D0A71C5